MATRILSCNWSRPRIAHKVSTPVFVLWHLRDPGHGDWCRPQPETRLVLHVAEERDDATSERCTETRRHAGASSRNGLVQDHGSWGTTNCPSTQWSRAQSSFRVVHLLVVSTVFSLRCLPLLVALLSLPFPIYPDPVLTSRVPVMLALAHPLTGFNFCVRLDSFLHTGFQPPSWSVSAASSTCRLILFLALLSRKYISIFCLPYAYLILQSPTSPIPALAMLLIQLRGAVIIPTPRPPIITRLYNTDHNKNTNTEAHMTGSIKATQHLYTSHNAYILVGDMTRV